MKLLCLAVAFFMAGLSLGCECIGSRDVTKTCCIHKGGPIRYNDCAAASIANRLTDLAVNCHLSGRNSDCGR